MRPERKTLDRALSRAGVMSRTQAEQAIREGRVRVNGLRERDPQFWVDLTRDDVRLDEQPLERWKLLYFALNKPVGLVTTREDERGRATVYTLLADVKAWVAPVGRLDKDTSGLLLFTNDTDLAERITNPQSKLEKTYECLAAGALEDDTLERLRRGVELDDGPTRPARVRRLEDTPTGTRIELTITEGRNRQVRRMLEAVGSRVLALHRVAIGPIRLGELAQGAHRPLTAREVRALKAE
ncbi:MAG: rRNA pseudouridine synthase [Planctomycetaceae bacterium]|nr:rRNA pseudouridine synthase [Planctomycetaceae bacterium]